MFHLQSHQTKKTSKSSQLRSWKMTQTINWLSKEADNFCWSTQWSSQLWVCRNVCLSVRLLKYATVSFRSICLSDGTREGEFHPLVPEHSPTPFTFKSAFIGVTLFSHLWITPTLLQPHTHTHTSADTKPASCVCSWFASLHTTNEATAQERVDQSLVTVCSWINNSSRAGWLPGSAGVS